MRKRKCTALAVLAIAAGWGCGKGGGGDEPGATAPGSAPSHLSMVTTGTFTPIDAVSSPDGATFFFSAYNGEGESEPAILRVAANGGSPTALHQGAPLGYPTGLVASCDGETVYVADMGGDPESPDLGQGALYSIAASGGTLIRLDAPGIASPSGLALADDCETLFVTGWNDEGAPGLFRVPATGGSVTTVHAGAPLASPTGMYVDSDNVAWVLDHLSDSEEGHGALFAIPENGEVTEVAAGLRFGTPGGCSLTSAGGVAVIPTLDELGNSQLTTIEIATGTVVQVPTPDIQEPAGLRTARNAPVFAVVDAEGGAIYRAE